MDKKESEEVLKKLQTFIGIVEKPNFSLYLEFPCFPRHVDISDSLEEANILLCSLREDISSECDACPTLTLCHEFFKKIGMGEIKKDGGNRIPKQEENIYILNPNQCSI